ncbi:MAG: hypothetical protein Kow0097_06350 [Candidatus Bipolaricaulota bacterium]
MNRWILVGLLVLAVAAAVGQEVPPRTMFEVADLELISHEALPGGTAAHSGPTCAAIVMAWFARHGYPALLPDLNEDGAVDEEDTLLLAARFAREMAVGPDRPALDPRLMDALARYVSERYPGEFALKLWDDSFASEYQAVLGKPLSPADYPGIEVVENPNATHSDYTEELLAGEGVILGLGREGQKNTYFVGRSFEFEENAGEWPVDVVDTADDPTEAGVQAQVFPTVMKRGPEGWWLVRYAGWVPLEFMLSLSPIHRPETATVPTPCPIGAIGYDVVTVDTEWGSFRVEECVTREGDRDLYTYTVTNSSFVYDGCGLCEFFVPNGHGFPTLAQWGPAGWLVNPWGEWSWMAPLGDCGLAPGESAVFGFAVPAPTTDTWQGAAVAGCAPVPAGMAIADVPWVKFRTTGPGPGETGCPDLAVIKLSACWRYTPQQEYEVLVTAIIQNVGTVASGGFWVCTEAGSGSEMHHVSDLAPGSTLTLTASLVVGSPAGVSFPILVEVEADCFSQVKECSEANNEATFNVGRENACK